MLGGDCCEIFRVEFQRVIAAFCLLTVEFLAALLLSSASTSHIVSFRLKMTTMTLRAAEITAGTKIN